MAIMILAIINGLITSIMLETIVMMTQNFGFIKALKAAIAMSFISLVGMEIAMNLTDYLLTGGATLTWVGSTNNVNRWFFNSVAL